ncbi:MAG: FitA-like ribbon-helix-helix domain-containing protein [Thermodesulfovibrionales bacterium]
MPHLLIRNLETETIERLKERAKLHNRSLQGEAKSILELSAKMTMEEARERAIKIRASFGKKKFTDSAELIREDRDR